jgi:RimJ/RimL family protein N-acetyltransferase
MRSESIVLEGSRVNLLPMVLEHSDELFECGKAEEIWTYLPTPVTSTQEMRQLVEDALLMREQGSEYPFVVFDKELGRIVGSTRFLNISLSNRNLEIGWTWYSPAVWRSRVNTECKYLLLCYCFENLRTVRVQFKADVRNTRSNRAIERIGAQREGLLRQDRIYSNGYVRDAYLYSIIDKQWDSVKMKLEHLLNS